jgi:type II secretory pathway component HofQ
MKKIGIIILMMVIWLAVNLPSRTMESEEKKEKKEKTLNVQKIKKIPKGDTKSYIKKFYGKPSKKYKGEPGDFIFKDADLENVIIFFAKQYKLNVIIDPGISGKVTCRMIQVPWDQALDVILKQQGLVMVSEGSITRAKQFKDKTGKK